MGLEQSASEALRLVTVSPMDARTLAGDVLKAARGGGNWGAVSVAERALGLVALHRNDLDLAISRLRASVAAGRRAGAPRYVGEARGSLASALVLRGRPSGAFREIESALRDLDGLAAARALTQRSAILQEMGRVDEALEDLRRALPTLRRSGDVQSVARTLCNRSLLLVRRHALAQAEADLLAARELCERHGLELSGVYVEQNLGYVKAQRGDVPAALHQYGLAEAGYRKLGLGLEVGTLLVDRAKLLLSVRLIREARAAAEAAVSAYERQHRDVHLPEAELVLSTVAVVEGDSATALLAAERALTELRRLGRREWLPLARYARLQALVADNPTGVRPTDARRIAEGLRSAGWTVPALEARILAGQLALQRGQHAAARRDLKLAGRARSSGPAEVRVRAWLSEAVLRRADGDRRRAVSALRAGLRVIEEHRATLSATDLRAHVSMHGGALTQLGLRIALEDRRARDVLAWAERGRAGALLRRPPYPPDDPVLAARLSELRITVTDIQQRRKDGRPAGSLVQQQVRLERAIRDHRREFPGAAAGLAPRPKSVGEIVYRLGDAALIEYVELDEQLHAVTVVAGRISLHALGPASAVRNEMDYLPFALHRLANVRTRAASRAAAEAVLRRAGGVFDDVLIRPLERHVADRPLVIVPSAGLQSLPWSVLPSCADRPLVVSPSTALWHAAACLAATPTPATVVAVAGPELPGAEHEAKAVAALYPGSVLLAGGAATAARLSAAIDGAGLVHLAAHGAVRADNPLFSALLMADGPFTIYDLERLRRAPRTVVLAACDTGRQHVLAGDEILGFTAALLAGGTATLVAPVVPVPDVETAPFMLAYHAHLRAGRSPAGALASAQAELRSADPVVGASAVGFVCLGAGLRDDAPPAARAAPSR